MGYVLLWIESLAVSLLFVATLAACLAQLGPGQARWVARGNALLLLCVGALAVVGLVASMGAGVEPAFLLLWIPVTVACTVGAGWALQRGRRLGAAAILIALVLLVVGLTASVREGPGAVFLFLWITVAVVCTVGVVWAFLREPRLRTAAVLFALLPWLVYAALTFLVEVAHLKRMAGGSFVAVMAMLTAAYTVGAGWLLVRGLRRGAGQESIRASDWPRGRLAVALLVAVALHLMTFWNLDLAARQQVATLRTEAGAAALSVAPPRLPDRDNAAIVYQQAFEAMGQNDARANGWQWEQQWKDAWEQKWTAWRDAEKIGFDLHDPELRRFLKRQASALALLRQAAAKPGCCFERDYGRPSIMMLMPELSPLHNASRLLALDALCRASDKDYRGAAEDVNAMFRMAEHLSFDPMLISQLMAMSGEGWAIDTLRQILASEKVTLDDLAVIQVPDGASYRTLLRRAFRMEWAFGLATFAQVGEGQIGIQQIACMSADSTHSFPLPMFAPMYRVFFLGDDIAAQARFATQMDQAARQPYAEGKVAVERCDQELGTQPGGLLTALLMPALAASVEHATRADARRGAVRAGLALYAYRAKHGRFPDKLDELAPDFIPAVPHDPFDGQAMKLRRTEKGAVVYSIGPDMTDDGGAPFDPKTKTGDIAFPVP